MICSTSTESLLTFKSDMWRPRLGFLRIGVTLAASELRRFLDARAQDADRSQQCLGARLLDLRRRAADVGIAVRIGAQRLPVAEQPAPRPVEDLLHRAPGVHGVPVTVVI